MFLLVYRFELQQDREREDRGFDEGYSVFIDSIGVRQSMCYVLIVVEVSKHLLQ